MKSLVLILTLAFTSSVFALDLTAFSKLSEKQSEKTAIQKIENYFKSDKKGFFLSKTKSELKSLNSYPSGDFYILFGIGGSSKDQEMTKNEYTQMWRIMNYLADKGFRVIINTKTDGDDLKNAAETEGTSVIVVSSHGNREAFYDFNSNPFPYDVFANKASTLYQVVISACYGSDFILNYQIPEGLLVYRWTGLTNSTELMNFLVGDSWDAFEGKP